MADRDKDGKNYRRFLDPAVLAGIGRMELRAHQAVEGFLAGMHPSPFFGHSVEFVQHREYTTGDDIRHLDWKVWSKTDRFYIKQFEAETNLRCTLVVDVSESMAYGSGPLNKMQYAATAAASAAWLLLRQQDAVGMVTFDSSIRSIIPPRSQSRHLDAIVAALGNDRPREKTDIFGILKKVAQNLPTRGLVAIFSDLLVDRDALTKGLQMLRQRKHEVVLFHLMDKDEVDFQFMGPTRFEGMESMPELLCDPAALREGYLRELGEFLQEVRRAATKQGVSYQFIRTDEPLDAVLTRFLHQREAVRQGRPNLPG
jgi:uncharacterized protein (DUF58 family)